LEEREGRRETHRFVEERPALLLAPGRESLLLRSGFRVHLRILVYLVIYDSGYVSLEHLLLSWYPSSSCGHTVFRYHTVDYVPSIKSKLARTQGPMWY